MIVLAAQKFIEYNFWFYLLTVCVDCLLMTLISLIVGLWSAVQVPQGSHDTHDTL